MIQMVKSMTGYGRCEETVGGRRITVELKSVNHKYFEFSPRVTRGYGFLEDNLKSYVRAARSTCSSASKRWRTPMWSSA